MSNEGDGFGLDKAARLKAEREQNAEAQKTQPLNPPFPYQAEPFDPEFFKLTPDPVPLADAAPSRD